MNVTVTLPDDSAARLAADLERRALEALVAEEYRAGRPNKPDLRPLLGFKTGYAIDGCLKAHRIYHDNTPADLEREREAFARSP